MDLNRPTVRLERVGRVCAAKELLSEFAPAHVEGSKTVVAYARDDLLEKRRPMMQAWSDFVGAPHGA